MVPCAKATRQKFAMNGFCKGAPALCVKLWLFFTTFACFCLVAYVGYIFQQGTFTSNPKHKRIATYYILTYVCIAPFNLQLYMICKMLKINECALF